MSEDRITRFMEVYSDKGVQRTRFRPTKIREDGDYYFIDTVFALKDEVKKMQGARWMNTPDIPESIREPRWRVNKNRRNDFAIKYLEGQNPYARWKTPLQDKDGQGFRLRKTRTNWFGEVKPLYEHQLEFVLHMLLRRQCIVAGEMGTGKTLAAIEAIELSLVPLVWYVAPKSAIAAVKLDCQIWKCRANIRFMTYDELKGLLKKWVPGDPPPPMIIFDESSRAKNATSQRSQACYYVAEAMRDHYGDKAYIIEMSGSPAPKSPVDWYHQCEIACPGYIAEGDVGKFQRRLAVMAKKSDMVGYNFQEIVCWRDGKQGICNVCGRAQPDDIHDMSGMFGTPHEFVPLTNEVNNLYRRMGGLVMVKFKKDCLDLPAKQYRVIKLKPSLDLLRAARIVQGQSRTAIEQMTLLRELSDGFQYRDIETSREDCSTCKGNKVLYKVKDEPEACEMCCGTGQQIKEERETIEVESPKIEALSDLLDENDEHGRLVVYAGFKASIDRICKHVVKHGWEFIRVDGRGWVSSFADKTLDAVGMLKAFQDPNSKFEKIIFVGHPGSAGMGLTLTAASMCVYYSNDFNGESRIQSEDRIHRPGMDNNRGATIVDLLLLPTDKKVLDNLRAKRTLQSITMNEVASAMDAYKYEDDLIVV